MDPPSSSPSGCGAGDDAALPPAAGDLPQDRRNTAPQTRARYDYQDECIALTVLRHLASDLAGILIEYSTDLVLIPDRGQPELVSIKHREPHHRTDSGWTWSALAKDAVLADLFTAWANSGRACTTAFLSNAGMSGPAQDLWKACNGSSRAAGQTVARRVAGMLKIAESEAAEFLAAFRLPQHPMPRRNEISDVGVRRTAGYLIAHDRDTRHADQCYRALVERIRRAGTDLPESRAARLRRVTATVRECAEQQNSVTRHDRYLSAEEIRAVLLETADAFGSPGQSLLPDPGWVADPMFTGRAAELDELTRLLDPGTAEPVAPVVIHGLSGTGKTSLAVHFAATMAGRHLKPVVIDGSTRASLIAGLEHLQGGARPASGVDRLMGPAAAALPGGPDTLLIIDGVTDPAVLRGLVPRRSVCRVVITSTSNHLDEGFQKVPLTVWPRQEARDFLRRSLPAFPPEDGERLAEALGDHPLALAQAVNYCQSVGIEVSEFLDRLALDPLAVMGQGQVSGHPQTVLRMVQLALREVERRDALALRLLDIASYFGSEPFPLHILDTVLMRPFVTERRSVRPGPRSGFLRRRKVVSVAEWGSISDERGLWARAELKSPVRRDGAVAVLAGLGLIGVDRGHMSVHPIVQRVVQSTHEDARPWIETAVGLCAGLLAGEQSGDGDRFHTVVGHAQAALGHARDVGFDGPAVIALGMELALKLCDVKGAEEGLPLARQSYDLTQSAHRRGLADATLRFSSQAVYARALAISGDLDTAVAIARGNVALASESGRQADVHHSYAWLGQVADWFSLVPLAREVLEKLPDPRDPQAGYNYSEGNPIIFAARVRAKLLMLVGRAAEAMDLHDWAVAEIAAEPSSYSVVWPGALLSDAAEIALGNSDPESRVESTRALVEELTKGRQDRHDRIYVEGLLTAADAELDRLNAPEAVPFLDRAEAILQEHYSLGSDLHSSFLAIRGRYRLTVAGFSRTRLEEAKADLRSALEILRPRGAAPQKGASPALIHLAQVHAVLGEGEQAFECAGEALELDLARYGEGHPEVEIDRRIIRDLPLQVASTRWLEDL
ncbi:hypothetical protein ACFZCK_26805 [Kitasatospora purpeofusca]|uniref:hypothetical protein n=1 Tax=Kitasatospora purpeofusca TaxID=67352 RepID=UPI0036E100ED